MWTSRKTGRRVTAAMAVVGTVALGAVGSTGAAYSAPPTQGPPPCATPSSPVPQPGKPTTISTIEQAYYCVFAHYFDGTSLDDRILLTGAFAGFTQELDRLGLDQPNATMPALSGDRTGDWNAFSAIYQQVNNHLPVDPTRRQTLAAATLTGMLNSLHDNHINWSYPLLPPHFVPGEGYGLGITTSPVGPLATVAPQEALPPLFIKSIVGGPAADADLKPGDIIESVNGAPPFADGIPSAGAINLLNPQYPDTNPVSLTLHRPATGRTWTMTMTPRLFTVTPAATAVVTSTLLDGHIADITLAGFPPNAANMVLDAIAKLRAEATLRGVILDLRGNGGGSPTEVARLLGAFTHGATWSYDCDATGACAPNRTDDSVPLLRLPLVVLTDRNCASACDAFSGTVKDLHVGTLVGTRTAGVVSGPAQGYLLSDNSLLILPAEHEQGAHHETINGIGVAPDYYLPLIAQDLSTGHDPDVAEAITFLKH